MLHSRTIRLLVSAALLLVACGLPQIPEPYHGSGVSFRPVILLRIEPLAARTAPSVIGGGSVHGMQVYLGNGFYINESGCFVIPLSLKRKLQDFSGKVSKDVRVWPTPRPVGLEHIGDLDESNLAVMRVTGVGTTTSFPLPDEIYKPKPGEKFLIITHEQMIGEVESDGEGVSPVSLTDAWGQAKRVVAYTFKGQAEGGSLQRAIGAPVVNSKGEAIGLWVGRSSNKEGVFALPVSRSAVKDVTCPSETSPGS